MAEMTGEGGRLQRHVAFTALALLALMASVAAPQRVLTVPVSVRVPLGGTYYA